MGSPLYVVDAFTDRPFAGNPAGVCLLDAPAPEPWMQSVAAEMRHAETAFLVPRSGAYQLRWFTPTVEVDLCGHATLAAAHVLFETGRVRADAAASFETKSGTLTAVRLGDRIQMDFPTVAPKPAPMPEGLAASLGATPIWYGLNGMDAICELADEEAVRSLRPSIQGIHSIPVRGLIVTARASGCDFVSRFFAPQSGVDEDPVTGSAHCCLAPYWAAKLDKNDMTGFQASPRGGTVQVSLRGDRTLLAGHAVTVLEGALRC